MRIIKTVLEQLSYSDIQVSIYVDLVENGASTLQEIAKRIDVPRTTLYDYYPLMLHDGLISQTSLTGLKKYQAESPKILQERINELESSVTKAKKELTSNLDVIDKLFKLSEKKPKISYYEGERGMKIVMSKILKYKEHCATCLGGSEKNDSFEHADMFIKWFNGEMLKRKIKYREITEDTPFNQEYKEKYNQENSQIKLCKKLNFIKNTHIDKFIFDKYVAIFDFTKEMVVLIEDENMARNERVQFEIMWESL